TVWLPAQPPDEQAQRWKEIEMVFGWAPGSDLVGRETKPWKPPAAGEHGKDESARAGAVVFHDASPERWPRLVAALVNNHHATYYQGDCPPGDWDAPVPVSFLAIPPGQAFSFALGLRRPDGSQEGRHLLGRAREWLDGALTHLGCG